MPELSEVEFAGDWEALAWAKLKSADHLLQIRQCADAYYLAGLAL